MCLLREAQLRLCITFAKAFTVFINYYCFCYYVFQNCFCRSNCPIKFVQSGILCCNLDSRAIFSVDSGFLNIFRKHSFEFFVTCEGFLSLTTFHFNHRAPYQQLISFRNDVFALYYTCSFSRCKLWKVFDI